MNGKAQFYLNIAMTLSIGLYGDISVLYSEFLKPDRDRNGWVIAFNLLVSLSLISAITSLLDSTYKIINKDSELPQKKVTN